MSTIDDLMAENAKLRAIVAELRSQSEILEAAPVAIQSFDKDGYAEYMNPAMMTLLGMPNAEISRGLFNILTSPEMVENGSSASFARAYAGERVESPEVPIQMSNFDAKRWGLEKAGLMWAHQVIIPIHDDQKNVVGTCCFMWDITERKATELAFLEAQRHEQIAILAGGIAHDFNNLLTGILGMATLAAEQTDLETIRRQLKVIQDAAEQAAALTHQLLAYAGKGQINARPMNPVQTIEDAIRLMTMSVPSNVEFSASFGDSGVINGDETQIRQVAMNLVQNAVEATEAHGGHVYLTAGCVTLTEEQLAEKRFSVQPGSYFSLVVEDDGHGMDEDTRSKMFSPFFTRKAKGHGLGLAATQGVVEQYGGVIRVDSAPDEGTRIELLLPCEVMLEEIAHDPSAELRAVMGNPTVLVVDDESSVRRVISDVLERRRINVIVASGGQQGIDLFRDNRSMIDLVLLDLTMPQVTGDMVFEQIREIDPTIPVVLMSGHSRTEVQERFENATVSGFLSKPFRAKDLARQVSAALPEA